MAGCTCEGFGLDCCCCYGECVVVDVVDVVVMLCNVLGDEIWMFLTWLCGIDDDVVGNL